VKSPQAENGHVDIANELVEALFRFNLSAYESRVLWFIFRQTYGWHKKTDRISYTQFEQTGLDRRNIGRTIRKLRNRKIITVAGNGQALEYGIQKDYDLWSPLSKETTVEGAKPLSISHRPLSKETTELLSKETNTKERLKKLSKETPPTPPKAVGGFWDLYQGYLGSPSPIMYEQIKDWLEQMEAKGINPDWYKDAFLEAEKNGKRSWPYIKAILERWVKEGRGRVDYKAEKTGGLPDARDVIARAAATPTQPGGRGKRAGSPTD